MKLSLTREAALKLIKAHGWESTQQTATKNGEWVTAGTSFDEHFGVTTAYDKLAVLHWLGY